MAHYKRKIATLFSSYGEIVRREHEKAINDKIIEIRKAGNTIVSIIPNKVGVKPAGVAYDLIYEEGRPSDRERCRFFKSIIFTISEVLPTEFGGEHISENKVNKIIDGLCDKGAKIIAIIPHNVGISPTMVMYDIIYEAENCLE